MDNQMQQNTKKSSFIKQMKQGVSDKIIIQQLLWHSIENAADKKTKLPLSTTTYCQR